MPAGSDRPKRERDAAHRLRGVIEIVVAGAGQANDDAVARQLVGAQPLEGTEILDAFGHDGGSEQQSGQDADDTLHDHPQKGLTREKKRPSQPWLEARAISPLPE